MQPKVIEVPHVHNALVTPVSMSFEVDEDGRDDRELWSNIKPLPDWHRMERYNKRIFFLEVQKSSFDPYNTWEVLLCSICMCLNLRERERVCDCVCVRERVYVRESVCERECMWERVYVRESVCDRECMWERVYVRERQRQTQRQRQTDTDGQGERET